MRRLLLAIIVAAQAAIAVAAEPSVPRLTEQPLTEGDRDHWAFRAIPKPELPAVTKADWVRTPVDRFILAKLEEADLTPLPPADRATLIRRVTLDLTGLQPTPAEVDAFLADKSPQAYEKLLDRLLASPAYGQRHAQHWLDLARYADTDGFEFDTARPEAWKYRDWVIDALNKDLPFDEFVRQQLAGDELYPDDAAAKIATGFVMCGPDMPDINLQEERRHTVMNELTSTVGAVLLGLQIGCAQCHDHKYEPMSQADFYRLRAIFEPGVKLGAKDKAGQRTLQEVGLTTDKSRLMIRGDFRRPGAELEPAFPRIANLTNERIPEPGEEAKSSGRRTALANWLTKPENPLFARVAANRLWQHHFGYGLVRSPSDFGVMGDPPSHEQLLDWLSGEYQRQGWSMKRMHKLLLTSAVYLQASRADSPDWTADERAAAQASLAKSREIDPPNRLLARMNRQRLDGETIRDCLLAASDRLNDKTGGPGVMPPLPQELLANLLKNQWIVDKDETQHRRRSVYLFVRRNLRYPLFEVFDKPDTNASCPQRGRSTTAPQSLWQLNSEFSCEAASELGAFVTKQAGESHSDQIVLANRRALAKDPSEEEIAIGRRFLENETARIKNESSGEVTEQAASQAALRLYCLALFNLNEFLYVD